MSHPEHNYILHNDLSRRRDMLQINHGMFFRHNTGHDIEKQQDVGQADWSHDRDTNQIQVITNRNNRLGLKSQRRKTMERKRQG
jgi:hypothetical protein